MKSHGLVDLLSLLWWTVQSIRAHDRPNILLVVLDDSGSFQNNPMRCFENLNGVLRFIVANHLLQFQSSTIISTPHSVIFPYLN
jgi:hypothetical protein